MNVFNFNRIGPRYFHRCFALIALGAMMLASGCTSARIVNTWRDPGFTGPIAFKKTVALALHPDGAVRRAAEDEMVKQIGPEKSVAGYSIVTDEERADVSKLKAKLEASGIDGAVTMKQAGKRSETTYVPGSAGYPTFYDDYRGAAYYASPGYVVTDTIVSIQTNIYSVAEGKLIWSGTSETFNPSDTSKVIGDIAKAVGAELRKEKLIP